MKYMLLTKWVLFTIVILVFSLTVFSSYLVNAQDSANASMIVEANIIGFSEQGPGSGVSIEVPDYIFLGNVTKDEPVSKEFKTSINNTGTVDITVTPLLADSNEAIFSYLYFRSHQTSNGTDVPYERIGDYSLNILKPSTGSTVRKSYCYMILNLTDFNGEIKEDLIGYNAEVIFVAMAQ
jgi:hypothetical protein